MSIKKEHSQAFDCEACRNEAGVMREYMITCPDCNNKRCPQALDHRYLCTGSNEKVQKFTLKTTPIYGESTSDDLGQSPHKWLFERRKTKDEVATMVTTGVQVIVQSASKPTYEQLEQTIVKLRMEIAELHNLLTK